MMIHVVQPNDTIDSIAAQYGVSVRQLLRDNGLENISSLVQGQTIVIVYPKLAYTVQEGDTLPSIANTYNVTEMQLIRNNPYLTDSEYLIPGENIVISYETNGAISTNGFAFPYINITTLKKTLPYLTYLTIFNYSLTGEGDIISYYDDTEIIKLAKEYGTIPLMMMTTLTSQSVLDIEIAYNILLNEEYQDKIIDNMLTILREKGYYGINIVFNYINTTNYYLYQNYVTKISNRFKEENFLLFVTINLKLKSVNNEVSFEKVDYSIISQMVNGIIFLQFIWGTNENPPMPVSSIKNIRTIVDYVLMTVEPDKTIVGELLIGYDWELPYISGRSSANSMTLNSVLSLARDVGAIIKFDEISQTPYFIYYRYSFGAPEVQHIVWFIDARSIEVLLELISEYGLGGSGVWNIMIYYPQLWLIINSQYEIIKYLI